VGPNSPQRDEEELGQDSDEPGRLQARRPGMGHESQTRTFQAVLVFNRWQDPALLPITFRHGSWPSFCSNFHEKFDLIFVLSSYP
jgi:hypothetical protein